MISLCMIVKNEEATLENCLKQIATHVEQIVIVDTGSTDKTKEIAFKYTKDVYDFAWCNDFSKARNFSLEKAMYDWVLVLDADEMITHFDDDNVASQIASNVHSVGRIKLINPFETGEINQKYIECVSRVFNRNHYRYEGCIHEQIVRIDRCEYTTFLVDITANHTGYTKEIVNKTHKIKRNIEMLNAAILKSPKDPYLFYQLGKSYYMQKTYHKAYDSFAHAINLGIDHKYEYTKDLIESYGYTLINIEKYREALDLTIYEVYYSDSPDYNFLLALIYMNNAMFVQALDYFEKCLGLKEGNIEGINSFQPYYNMGVIYEVLGDKHRALYNYHHAGDYVLAFKRGNIIESQLSESFETELEMIQRDIAEGAYALARIKIFNLQSIKTHVQLKIYLGIVEIIEGEYIKGINVLTDVFIENPTNYDIAYNIAFAYNELGQGENALEWINIIRNNSNNVELLEEIETLNSRLKEGGKCAN